MFVSCNLSSYTSREGSVFSLSAGPAGVGGQHRPVEEGEQLRAQPAVGHPRAGIGTVGQSRVVAGGITSQASVTFPV